MSRPKVCCRWIYGRVTWYPKKAFGPAQPGQISYDVMLPKDVDNLLLPVAMSSTHIAMSVLRIEPMWMTTGQIAGLARRQLCGSEVQLQPSTRFRFRAC